MAAERRTNWEDSRIGHCIRLFLSKMEKNEPLLISSTYFWSDALNAFLFGHGPMSPNLLDVFMLTGLDVTTPIDPFSLRTKPSYKVKSKNQNGWSGYISLYSKVVGIITDEEHALFLNMWLENFVLCGSTSGPTANMLVFVEQLS